MNIDLFSIPIYYGRVYEPENFENSLNKYLIELQNSKQKSVVNPDFWDCNVTTTFTKEYNAKHQWQDEFLNTIKYNFFQYIETLRLLEQKFIFKNIWVNLYNKNDFQEVHDHMPNHFSYAYAHKIPENSGNFVFVNQSFYNMYHHYNNPQIASKKFAPEFKEKHILIFPSFACHMVTANRSDDVRITISGNIDILDDNI